MPSPSNTITRFELGSTFEEFDLKMNQKGFIAAKVLRPRIVAKNASDVGKVPLKQLLQSRSTRRNSGNPYPRDNFEFDKFSYAVQEYGKEEPLDDNQLAMYGDIIDAERIAADRAEDAVLNEYERDVAALVFNTTTWTGASLTTAVATKWNVYATATPVDDVMSATEKVSLASGLDPNALIVSRGLLRDLLRCAQIVDRIKYAARPTADEIKNALADLFGLPNIIVGGGFKNTANEGQAASLSRIWPSTYAMVARVAESDDPREPCIGRTFIWDGDGPGAPGDGGSLAVVTEQYREEGVRGTIYRARNNRDQVIMYANAGHLLEQYELIAGHLTRNTRADAVTGIRPPENMSRASHFHNLAREMHLEHQGESVIFKTKGLVDLTTTGVVHEATWDVEGMTPVDRTKRWQRVIEFKAEGRSPRQGDVLVIVSSDEKWVIDYVMGTHDGWHIVMTKRDEAMSTAGRRLSPRG